MPFLPIAERELRVAARRRNIYRLRFWAVLTASIVFVLQFIAAAQSTGSVVSQGAHLFLSLSVLAIIFAAFAGLYTTSDCLSAEKREGTLGLLFLTDMRGYDIVIGKLVASSLGAAYGLVAILPILAVPILMGGVTVLSFLRALIAIASILFLSLSAGMVASVHNRHERKSTFYTVLILFLVISLPFGIAFAAAEFWSIRSDRLIVTMLSFSPGFMIVPLFGPVRGIPAESYWIGVAVCWAWTTLFLAWASFRLPLSWQERVTPKTFTTTMKWIARLVGRHGERKTRTVQLSRLLDINPFLWLSFRAEKKRNYVWVFLGSMIGIWLLGYLNYRSFMRDADVLAPMGLMLNTFLKVWIATEACQQLIEARRSGALELLLSTPLTDRDIIRGQWLALRRQFGWPLMVLGITEAFFIYHNSQREGLAFVWLLTLPIDFLALGWAGMWLGLTAKNTTRAILKAVVLVLAVPWLIFYLSGVVVDFLSPTIPRAFVSQIIGSTGDLRHLHEIYYGLLSLGAAYLVGFRWARQNLIRRFRTLASEQYHSKRTDE